MTRRVPFLFCLLASMVVLFLPAQQTPTVRTGVDTIIHVAMFAVLAATGRWAGISAGRLFAGLVVYAGVSEVLQAVLPIGRDGGVVDAAADVVGVALGLLVAAWSVRRRATRRPARA